MKCKATKTRTGKRCKRNAALMGYCITHYRINMLSEELNKNNHENGKPICPKCGGKKTPNSKRCRKCYASNPRGSLSRRTK